MPYKQISFSLRPRFLQQPSFTLQKNKSHGTSHGTTGDMIVKTEMAVRAKFLQFIFRIVLKRKWRSKGREAWAGKWETQLEKRGHKSEGTKYTATLCTSEANI